MKAKRRQFIGNDGAWIGVDGPRSRYAGAYVLGDRDMIMVWYVERPPWYKRRRLSWLLGWEWTDVATLDERSDR